MSFTVFFPAQKADGAYKHLDEEHEVYEVVKDEVRQTISDMGSEGYELLLPEWPYTAECNDKTYNSTEEIEQDEDAHTEWVMLGHERGIDQATTMWAPGIFKELWVRYRVGVGTGPEGEDTAIDDVTYSKLPDGTVIALKEEED